VTLGNHVLFNGLDSIGLRGLWVTDGTGVNTHELAGTGGLDPTDLTAVGNQVYFNGADGVGHRGLWVTDGIDNTMGQMDHTHPVTVGFASGGLNPAHITYDFF
jgi:hypothetical protein